MDGIWTTDELLDSLYKAPLLLDALLIGVDDDRARLRPAEGEWSTVEVVGHLIDAEQRAIERIGQIQRADNPVLAGYDADALVREHAYQQRALAELVAQLHQLRAQRIEILSALSSDEWQRTAQTGGRDAVPLTAITVHMCWHDTNHLNQIASNLSES